MKVGYVRVSKHEQNEALQIDALKAAECEKWFVDKITIYASIHWRKTEKEVWGITYRFEPGRRA